MLRVRRDSPGSNGHLRSQTSREYGMLDFREGLTLAFSLALATEDLSVPLLGLFDQLRVERE